MLLENILFIWKTNYLLNFIFMVLECSKKLIFSFYPLFDALCGRLFKSEAWLWFVSFSNHNYRYSNTNCYLYTYAPLCITKQLSDRVIPFERISVISNSFYADSQKIILSALKIWFIFIDLGVLEIISYRLVFWTFVYLEKCLMHRKNILKIIFVQVK